MSQGRKFDRFLPPPKRKKISDGGVVSS
jgi:hypothetical protein